MPRIRLSPCTLSAERLRELLDYDPETGIFRWKVNRGNNGGGKLAGSRAGSTYKHGYRFIKIDGERFLEHRLAWMYMLGEWPKHLIDHKNGVKHDNRFTNLREATSRQNNANRRRSRLNKTGYKGVKYEKRRDRFCAYIRVNGKRKYLGYFRTPEDAHNAYIKAAEKHHGEFARAEFCFGLAV